MKVEGAVCSICSHEYDNDAIPWRLSCGHSLCSACMDDNFSKETPCAKCLVQQSCVSSSSLTCGSPDHTETSVREKNGIDIERVKVEPESVEVTTENSLEPVSGDTRVADIANVKVEAELSSVTSEISGQPLGHPEENENLSQEISSTQDAPSCLSDNHEGLQIPPPLLDSRDVDKGTGNDSKEIVIDLTQDECDEINVKQESLDESTGGSLEVIRIEAERTLQSLPSVTGESSDSGLTSDLSEDSPSSTASKTATEVEMESAQDWREKDVKQIDEKIARLREIQSQMTELMNQKRRMQVYEGLGPLTNVPNRELEAKVKIQEINDLVLSLENLKMEVQFANLSAVISKTKKEVDQVHSTVRQHIEEELYKSSSSGHEDDDFDQEVPINTPVRVPNELLTKYYPVIVEDSLLVDGETVNFPMRHLCITAMDEYKHKSFEELRFEHYVNCMVSNLKWPFYVSQPPQWTSLNPQQNEIGDYGLQNCEIPGSLISCNVIGEKDSSSELDKCGPQLFPFNGRKGTSPTKYSPTKVVDCEEKTNMEVITAMKEYADKSFEELRVEHYLSDGIGLGLESFRINRTYKGLGAKSKKCKKRLNSLSSSPQILTENSLPEIVVPEEFPSPVNSVENSMLTKFNPISDTEIITKNGCNSTIRVYLQVITEMLEYKGKSFEELRIEHMLTKQCVS
ncbi:uncharacterized protein [Palaemon carinicauda]